MIPGRPESCGAEAAREGLRRKSLADCTALRDRFLFEERSCHAAASRASGLRRALAGERAGYQLEVQQARESAERDFFERTAMQRRHLQAEDSAAALQGALCGLAVEAESYRNLAASRRSLHEADSTNREVELEALRTRTLAWRRAQEARLRGFYTARLV
mmetsp:Transcript_6019/g.14860  ORF Transcript_6019/g.14860 Transcript_6019/m.14860 type:complete len:160 (-) Transcript_6019:48-527(-)